MTCISSQSYFLPTFEKRWKTGEGEQAYSDVHMVSNARKDHTNILRHIQRFPCTHVNTHSPWPNKSGLITVSVFYYQFLSLEGIEVMYCKVLLMHVRPQQHQCSMLMYSIPPIFSVYMQKKHCVFVYVYVCLYVNPWTVYMQCTHTDTR